MTNFKTVFGVIVAAFCVIFAMMTMGAFSGPIAHLLGDTYTLFGRKVYTFVSEADEDLAAVLSMVISITIWSVVFIFAKRVRDAIGNYIRRVRNLMTARKLLK